MLGGKEADYRVYRRTIQSQLVLCLVGALAAFAAAAVLFQITPAFAETQQYDQASVDTSSPRSFSRGVSDGLSVTSAFANAPPGNFAPRVFHRAITETVHVTAGMPGSTQQAEALGPQLRTSSPHNLAQNQRPEDRLNLKNLSHKGDVQKNYGAVQQSGTPIILETQGQGDFDVQELATASDEADDNLRLARSMAAALISDKNQFYYESGLYGSYSIALLGLVAYRSPFFRNAARSGSKIAGLTVFSERGGRIVAIVGAIALAGAMSTVAFPVVEALGADTNEAAMVYRSNDGAGGDTPKYREWDPSTSTWGSEVELPSAGDNVRFAIVEYSPVSTKRVVVAIGQDGTVDSYVCDTDCTDPSSWTVTNDIVDLWSSVSGDSRPIDIEFEYSTGDLIMVYDYFEGDSNAATDIAYRIMKDSETSFGTEQWIDDSNATGPDTNYTFLRMDSKRKSGAEDIGLVVTDATNSDASAFVWDGSAWGNQQVITTSVSITSEEAVGIAYESNNADLMVVAGQSGDVKYAEFDDVTETWGAVGTVDSTSTAIGVGTINWIILRPNPLPASDGIFLAVSGSSNDLDSAYWAGGSWSHHAEHDTGIDTNGSRNFDFTWDGDNPGRGLLVYGTTSGVINYKLFAAPTSFGLSLTLSDDQAHEFAYAAQLPNPVTGDDTAALIAIKDGGDDISVLRWTGSTNAPTNLGDDGITTAGVAATMNFGVAWKKSNVVKRWIADSVTFADSISYNVHRQRSTADTLTITPDIIAENGAPDTSLPAAAAYRSNTGTFDLKSPKYREWDPATQAWSAEVELPNTGDDVREVRIAFSPVTSMRAIMSHSADGNYNLFVCDSACTSASNWQHVGVNFGDSGGPDPGRPYRPFDIAFETSSGDLLIVYDQSGAVDADFYYRTYDGVTLSSEQSFDYIGSSADDEEIRYFRMASNPASDEITMVLEDIFNQDVYAFVWDGSSFGNQKTITSLIGSASITSEAIGVAYDKEGRAVAFSANNSNSAAYAFWNGLAWSSVSTTDPNPLSGNDIRFVSMKGDQSPGTEAVMVCVSDDLNDLSCAPISGGVAGSWTTISTDISAVDTRPFDFVWNPSGSKGVITWNEASGAIKYRVWNGAEFGSEYSISSAGTQPWIVGATTGSIEALTNAMFAKLNSNFDGGAMKFKGDIVSLIGDASLTADTVVTTFESVSIDVQRVRKVKRPLSDSVALTDTITYKITRSLSDSFVIDDEITKAVNKQVADSLSVTESVAKVFEKNVDDSFAVTDVITKSTNKLVEDSIALTDTITYRISRSMSDDLAVTDTISASIYRFTSDNLEITEKINTNVTRSLGDSISITDDPDGKVTARTITDSLDVDDAITFRVSRSMDDSVQVTDDVTARVTARVIDDSVAITDGITVMNTRPVADSVELADSISMKITRSIFDSLEVTDAASRLVSRTTDDTLDIDDAISISVTRSVSESMAVSDSIAKSVTKQVSDSLEVADSVTAKVAARGVSDSLETADEIAIRITRSVSDMLSLVDDVIGKVTARIVSDDLGVSDGITINVTRSVSDSVGITDDVDARVTARVIDDSLEVTDNITSRVTRSVSDSIEITDTISKSVNKLVSDEVEVTDIITRSTTRSTDDEVSIDDSISTNVSRFLTETIDIADDASPNITSTVEDEVAIEDSISMAVTRDISDSIDLNDTASAKVTGRTVSDDLEVTDVVTATVSRQVEETVDFDDDISTRVTRSIDDELQVTDDANAAVGRSINDALDIDDDVTASVTRSMQDEVEVTDEITTRVTRTTEDEVEVTDQITTRVSRSIDDSLEVTDDVSSTVPRAVSDELELTDEISVTVTRDVSDTVEIDDDISTRVTRSIDDELEVTDEANRSIDGSADDALDIDDSISTRVTRSIDDELEVTDEITKAVTKLVSDEIEVTEEVRGLTGVIADDDVSITDEITTAVSRSIDDSVAVTDDIDMRVSRQIDEEIVIEDEARRSILRSIFDSITVEDDVDVSQGASTSDTLDIDDSVNVGVSSQAQDTLEVDDSITTRVSRSISDSLNIDDQASGLTARTADDELEVTDGIAKAVSKELADELTVADDITFNVSRTMVEEIELTDAIGQSPSRDIPEALQVTDEISKSTTKGIEDTIQVTDEISAKITGIAIADNLHIEATLGGDGPGPSPEDFIDVTDSIVATIVYVREITDAIFIEDSTFQPPTPRESIAITDSISIGLLRLIDDSVGIADEARKGWFVPIADSLQVAALLTEVTWVRTLGFDESFGLSAGICVPSECVENMGYPEGLGLSDSLELTLSPPPELEEVLAVTDQITLGLKVSAVPPLEEELEIDDSVTAQIVGILVVEDKDAIGPLPSTTVSGNYTYTGDAGDLKNDVIPIPIPINSTVVRPNLPGDITILRTYSVPIVWTDDIPTDNVIMSESQLEVPAYSNMFMRLNFEETPSLSGHSDFISMLDIEFTPKVDATDFGLVVSVTDLPAYAPEPTDELKPVYLDVRWWGDFPGAEDPSVQDYYENPPTFTFTVNDEWVEENSALRDSNGVPELKLWLLNEGTSEWERITDIDVPTSGVDGTYTFTATLPHFSNYAITANVGDGGSGGGGGGGGGGAPESFAVQLLDGIDVHEGTQMSAITIIEEYLQPKKVSVFISDLVAVASKPVALPTEIKVDQDLTVKIGLDEVKETNLTDPGAVVDAFTNPSALAEIVVQITNDGEEDRQFEFTFTYNDEKGELHSQTAVLDVGGDSTVTRHVELPFTEPGTYVITVEVRNLPGGDLAGFSTLTIVIPWLKLYLYTIFAVAGAVLGISGIAIAIYLLSRPEIPLAAGAGGAGLAVAAYKRRSRVRLFAKDEEEFKKDHKYRVLARLELRKVVHSGSQLKAMFALDIWSKKDGMEFVVTYRAVNALGVIVHESHVRVPAMPDLQSLSIVMPFASTGHYTIQAEARFEVGGDVLDKAALPVTISI